MVLAGIGEAPVRRCQRSTVTVLIIVAGEMGANAIMAQFCPKFHLERHARAGPRRRQRQAQPASGRSPRCSGATPWQARGRRLGPQSRLSPRSTSRRTASSSASTAARAACRSPRHRWSPGPDRAAPGPSAKPEKDLRRCLHRHHTTLLALPTPSATAALVIAAASTNWARNRWHETARPHGRPRPGAIHQSNGRHDCDPS